MRLLASASALVVICTAASAQVSEFSLKKVAGTKSDLMIVRHLMVRGSNEAIGRKLAEIARKEHDAQLLKWNSNVIGQSQLKWFQANYPERMERAAGVRAAYGLSPKSPFDITSVPINMRPPMACSVVYYPGSTVGNGHSMLSRNYDFPKGTYSQLTGGKPYPGERSMTGDPYVIEMYPNKGYPSLFICAYDLVGGAIDGVNSKGVTVALLADDMSKKRTRGARLGLSEVDLPRFVLDRCASAKEARKLLMKAPYYATFTPCHYIIGDATGDSFIFEVDVNDKPHIIDGNSKPQVITNHSIFEYGVKGLPQGNSFDRYRNLLAEIGKRKGKLTPTDVKEINYCAAVPTNVQVAGTLWHAVYDLQNRSVKVSFCLSRTDEKKERRTPYLDFKLKAK
jgi:penicillin V acylase-like amidase (Ntn superfamily)